MQENREGQSSCVLETGNRERKSKETSSSVAVESRRVVGGGETHGLDRVGERGYCRDCYYSEQMKSGKKTFAWWRCNHHEASAERRATYTHDRICDVGRYATRQS